jgi:Mn-dependent DtxR family transcriptional regulator
MVMKNITKKKGGKLKLTEFERQMRNAIICHMSRFGATNNNIARVMNVTPSIVSRAIDDEECV